MHRESAVNDEQAFEQFCGTMSRSAGRNISLPMLSQSPVAGARGMEVKGVDGAVGHRILEMYRSC